MKKYVVIMLFDEKNHEILLIERNKNSYKDCYNGIGGKIEEGETRLEAVVRECNEEINIKMINLRVLVTYTYPSHEGWGNNDIEFM